MYGAEAVASKDLLSAGYFFQVFGSLLLVLGLVFGLLFLLRKINGLPSGSKATIRVLGSVRLGSREKMILVQAGEQQLLIGVAPGGISTLHTFEKPIEGWQTLLPYRAELNPGLILLRYWVSQRKQMVILSEVSWLRFLAGNTIADA